MTDHYDLLSDHSNYMNVHPKELHLFHVFLISLFDIHFGFGVLFQQFMPVYTLRNNSFFVNFSCSSISISSQNHEYLRPSSIGDMVAFRGKSFPHHW